MTEEQIIINKLKRVWDNCLNSELRNTIDTTIACIEKLQDENENIQQSCENYYNEMRSYKNKVTELEKQIIDLKDYTLKVSKFLHNNNNVRPDNLAYKERDMLLIKELKLFEKWELKENDS